MNSSKAISCVLIALYPVGICAQRPLTIGDAVDTALKSYASIRVSQELINAAASGIQLARTAYLPHVDLLAQGNRATRNNVFGMLLPQSTIPSISGPVLGTNNFGTAWGSAIGTLVTWEPFDFGLRKAGVDAAAAVRARREATLKRTQFEVASATADAYVTLAAAEAAAGAAQAGVDRAQVLMRTTGALVNAQLRPGADASRAQAENAAATTQLIQAKQAIAVARANLSQFVGTDPGNIAVNAGGLMKNAPAAPTVALQAGSNPLSMEQNAVVDQLKAQLRTLERSYFPRFYLQGAAYARGTGAEVNGTNLGGLNGLAPTTQNYAVGLTITFSALDFAALRAKESEQTANIRSAEAQYQQIAAELKARWNAAVAMLEGARGVAANTPVAVSAARAATEQATARYQAGLGTIDDVAESQRLLTQAEIDNALAGLGVWRALLGVATAAGDLQPFLAEAGR